mmetsp:Transcript_21051/g.46391  ORF Transcript_21051/g.46391 Transcript_21051/m.46391 type:complete len:334 (+) Transcript_21051:616-1617(+)
MRAHVRGANAGGARTVLSDVAAILGFPADCAVGQERAATRVAAGLVAGTPVAGLQLASGAVAAWVDRDTTVALLAKVDAPIAAVWNDGQDMGHSAATLVAETLLRTHLVALEPAGSTLWNRHLLPVRRETLAAFVVLRRVGGIVANEVVAVRVVLSTPVSHVPRASEGGRDVHRTERFEASAPSHRTEACEAIYGAGFPWEREGIHWASRIASRAFFLHIANVPACSAGLVRSGGNKHAALTACARSFAALVRWLRELAGSAVAAYVHAGAVCAAAIAVLASLYEAVAADGVAIDSCWHIFQALAVPRVGRGSIGGEVEEAVEVCGAAARELC